MIRRFFSLCILSALMLVAVSCSCDRRMRRIRVYCPECFTTETIRDTFVIPECLTDTAFVFRSDTDTVVMERERLKIRLVRVHDTIRLLATVPADTVVRTVTVEKLVQPPKGGERLREALTWCFVSLPFLAVLALIFVNRRQK